jgi:excisionase family DNA binding protein
MSTAKSKTNKRPANAVVPKIGAILPSEEVLTLGEAAAYLRVADTEVLRLVNLLDLPGRQIGHEWRFLTAALQDWLRAPARKLAKDAFLAVAGSWKDDPDIEHIVNEAIRRRGRPMAGNER